MALKRSTARNIFAVGSFLCFVALVSLTVDLHQVVPERTNEETAMTEEVLRGKDVWEKYNCINCHGRLGEGAYYAPDLTKAYSRMGEDWIKHMLQNPAVAYWGPEWNQKGRRKMPQLGLTPEEAADTAAFLKFLDQIDTNNWPPKESYTRSTYIQPDTPAWKGKEVFERLQCVQCHAMNGIPARTPRGPDLTFVVSRLPAEWIRSEILTPQKDWSESPMPDFSAVFQDGDVDNLIAYMRHTNAALGGVEAEEGIAGVRGGARREEVIP